MVCALWEYLLTEKSGITAQFFLIQQITAPNPQELHMREEG